MIIEQRPGACFSKVPNLFGLISGATIAFLSSQRRGSRPSNFAVFLVFLVLKTCKKISFSIQADCCLTTDFSGLSRNEPQKHKKKKTFLNRYRKEPNRHAK